MQQKVLTQVTDPDLRIYSVWVPILARDSQENAQKATSFLTDDRAEHFWTPGLEVANSFGGPIGLTEEPAWDVFLLYGPETVWEESPPQPDFFMHQLSDRLPPELLLNGDRLLEKTREVIAKKAQRAERSSHPTQSSTG